MPMIKLGPAPNVDPTPMTREGTQSLVERFYALRRQAGTEVGVGGCLGDGSVTSFSILLTEKTKRLGSVMAIMVR